MIKMGNKDNTKLDNLYTKELSNLSNSDLIIFLTNTINKISALRINLVFNCSEESERRHCESRIAEELDFQNMLETAILARMETQVEYTTLPYRTYLEEVVNAFVGHAHKLMEESEKYGSPPELEEQINNQMRTIVQLYNSGLRP
jgi:hypothetical protein